MNYGEFMAYHRSKPAGHLYLLAGEESYYIDKAEKKIVSLLFPEGCSQDDIQVLNAPSVDAILGSAASVPFFVDKNVIIVRGLELFREKRGGKTDKSDNSGKEESAKPGKAKRGAKKPLTPEEQLLELCGNMPDFSYVIFECSYKADKRKKLTKTVAKYGLTLEAEPIRAWNVDEWLQGKLQELHKTMDQPAKEFFLTAVSMMEKISLGYLDQELQKLALLIGPEERRIDRRMLVKVFSNIPEVSGFALLDAIDQHNMKRSLYLVKRQLDDGVYMPLIVSMLVRHVRQLWQAKDLQSKGIKGRQLAGPMGLNPFIAAKMGISADSFQEAVLKKAFLDLADLDYRLKTGQGESAEVEGVVIDLCRLQA